MKHKILILATWYPTPASPVGGIFVQEQARLLARSYDVAVLVPRLVGWREVARGAIGPRSTAERDGGLPVRRERALAPIPRVLHLTYSSYARAARRGLLALVEDWGAPDLIHAHVVLPGGWAAAVLGAERGVPVVLTEHSSPFGMHLNVPYTRSLVRRTLSAVTTTLAVSPGLVEQIAAFEPGARVQVLGNVIRTSFFTPGEPAAPREGAPRLLTIALLSRQKGVTYLLGALAELRARGGPSVELVVGGDGPERAALEEQARKLGLGATCRFVGALSREETRDWMRWCDVFILPSLHETFGIVVGEAMACGKPVIATRCGGPEFLVTPESGLLVAPGDPRALADGIAAWVERRGAYDAEVIRRGVVERFGEEAFLRNISQVYEQVWTGQGAPR